MLKRDFLKLKKCPYGGTGDRLWVRETWYSPCESATDHGNVVYRATATSAELHQKSKLNRPWRPSIFMPRWASRLNPPVLKVRVERVQDITAADCIAEGIFIEQPSGADIRNIKKPDEFDKWTQTKQAEYIQGQARCTYLARCGHADEHIEKFAQLWDSINAAPKPVTRGGVVDHYVSYPWDARCETREHRGKLWHVIGNPWVWVVGFKSEVAS